MKRFTVSLFRHPDKKLFILSVMLSKHSAGSIAISMAQGWRIAANKEEAIGSFIQAVPTLKPGYSIDETLCLEISWESLLLDDAVVAEPDAGVP